MLPSLLPGNFVTCSDPIARSHAVSVRCDVLIQRRSLRLQVVAIGKHSDHPMGRNFHLFVLGPVGALSLSSACTNMWTCRYMSHIDRLYISFPSMWRARRVRRSAAFLAPSTIPSVDQKMERCSSGLRLLPLSLPLSIA